MALVSAEKAISFSPRSENPKKPRKLQTDSASCLQRSNWSEGFVFANKYETRLSGGEFCTRRTVNLQCDEG